MAFGEDPLGAWSVRPFFRRRYNTWCRMVRTVRHPEAKPKDLPFSCEPKQILRRAAPQDDWDALCRRGLHVTQNLAEQSADVRRAGVLPCSLRFLVEHVAYITAGLRLRSLCVAFRKGTEYDGGQHEQELSRPLGIEPGRLLHTGLHGVLVRAEYRPDDGPSVRRRPRSEQATEVVQQTGVRRKQ